MRKMTALSVGESAISIEEKKIAKGVGASNQLFATHCKKCRPQIRRPFGVEFKWFARRGMAECQSRRVQCLTGSRPLHRLGGLSSHARDAPAPPARVYRIAHQGVADVLEVDPDLVGPPGVELEPEQVGDTEATHDEGVGPGLAAGRGHRHALSVGRVAGNGGFDHRRALIEVSIAALSAEQRDSVMDRVYSFITGVQFRQRISTIVTSCAAMEEDDAAEKRALQKQWAKRSRRREIIVTELAGMWGDLQGIAGNCLPEMAVFSMPLLDNHLGDAPAGETATDDRGSNDES